MEVVLVASEYPTQMDNEQAGLSNPHQGLLFICRGEMVPTKLVVHPGGQKVKHVVGAILVSRLAIGLHDPDALMRSLASFEMICQLERRRPFPPSSVDEEGGRIYKARDQYECMLRRNTEMMAQHRGVKYA